MKERHRELALLAAWKGRDGLHRRDKILEFVRAGRDMERPVSFVILARMLNDYGLPSSSGQMWTTSALSRLYREAVRQGYFSKAT